MSKRLDLRFFLSFEACCLRKYFCAWLATCVGVLVGTYFIDIPLQSPFPRSFNPARKVLCSSSVHGVPERLVKLISGNWFLLKLGETIKCGTFQCTKFGVQILTGLCVCVNTVRSCPQSILYIQTLN